VDRKPLILRGREEFEFYLWKNKQSIYVRRRSDGEMRVIEFKGSDLPLGVAPFRCEVDGITIPFTTYEILRVSFSEWLQLRNIEPPQPRENVPQAAQRRKSAGKRSKKPSKEVRAARSAAGQMNAKVTVPRDRKKIKAAFFRRVNCGISYRAAAREIAELLADDQNPLELEKGPYYISPTTVKRIAVKVK
jgi:hypothetical protein